MYLALFGPPGAGKGTQAVSLCDELGVPHIATGDIFRKNLKEGTDLGNLARTYMDRGQLVPDDVVCDLVEDRLSEADCAGGVLLDGFPRSVRQAERLEAWLESRGRKMGSVVSLDVADPVLVARLSGRRSCLGCGATYHVDAAPPRAEGVCDRCEGDVVQRSDDNEVTVQARLATYHASTAPVLDYYRERNVTAEVDGVGSIEEIGQRIRLAIA
jgi:adenylate kinase